MERLSFKEWQVLSDLEVLDSIPEDFEFSMARGELKTIKRSVDRIMKHLGGEGDLEAWVQSKITKANDYLNSVSNHMDGGEDDTKKEVKEGKIGKECSCCGDTITEDGCGCGPECGHCGGKGKVEESLKEEKCGDGMYYCKSSKKCKKIPKGYRVGKDGMLVKGVRWQDSDGDGKWYEPGDDVSEGIMPEPIDPKKHKAAQKKQKMRNLAIGNDNPNDKKVAEKKAGGPKMIGEGAVEDLEKGMETLKSITYDSIDGLMKKIAEDHDISTTKLHYMFKAKHDMTPDDWAEKNLKEEMSNWRQDLDEKCWKGYEKKGMKTMFGKRYPNCVKKEEVEQIDEVLGTAGKLAVRQGIKVAGKRGGRAVQGGLKSGKTATKSALQQKQAGKGEKIGKVVGAVAGGMAGGAAGGGVASLATGVAGGEVGQRVGGAIGKKIDKMSAKKPQKKVVVNPQVMETTEVIGEEGDNKVTPINKGKRMDAKKQAMKDMGKTPYDLNTARRRAKGQGILDNLLGKPPTTEEVVLEKRDGKSAKSKGYSLRDWFKGGGWVQAGGKYDGKPCAKQPGQTTKPFCRDADDRAAMTKDEREKRAAKKRREDPNPERKGKAKIVTEGQGETAKPRTKNLQRPTGKQPKASYRDQMRAKQRQERLERQKSVDSSTQRGPTASKEAKKAEEKRKQNDPRTSRLRGTIADRMAQGAKEHGLTEKTEEIRYCPKCKKPETRSDCRYGVDYWDANSKAIVAEKKDACYHKVKSRYSVWPSAYASGALVKCRKVGAKNWGNKTKKEGYEFSDWRDDFKPTEIQSFDIIKAEPLVDVNSITEPVQLATEDYQRLQSTGNVFCIMLTWRGQPYRVQLFFPGGSRPSREEVKGEVDKLYPGAVISHYYPAPTDPTQPIVVIQR